ncbi:aminotransferase-like domain-containing protein [Sphingobacterium griseoflavum]|uniref:GntR family transcriptional regulator n=1 Tax=Sphingobacterium griseoflavum TaxID=1474952 RepID=A0ABQ3HS70_9SPHI|nr:PLP-dependent aminotransferase family protein [Sphingobacterium griseoflavum]GHE23183.1 GntR family transcriptional regulator [Sphingobacterium griseoflavum]
MPSPVDVPYRSFIKIDRTSNIPIYLQIANEFIKAIQRNILLVNSKLPGTRVLGQLLCTHRNTVVAAYDELAAQGWVVIQPNRGAFVSASLPTTGRNTVDRHSYPTHTGFYFQQSSLLDNPYEHGNYQYILNDGTPDIRLTQIDDLSRIYSSTIKRRGNRRKMDYYNQEGSEYFKEQLLVYLHLSRGLYVSGTNVLITRSTEMSLFIISEILLKPNDTVVVGALSYFSANMIFQKNAARIRTIPIDSEGIDTDALALLCEQIPIRMVYVSPQHHYPTTATLSEKRRIALLALAEKHGFAIVEDDQDYDFHYNKQPMLPIATADRKGMVIYVSSFGKSLVPGFRTGFIVAPENLMFEMRKHLGIIDRQGDVLMEQALGEMIEEGVIHRHLKKSLKIYKERRDHMGGILQAEFSSHLYTKAPTGGLAFWLQFKRPTNLLRLSKSCAQKGLFLPKTMLYQNKDVTGIRLGFGNLDSKELSQSLALLKSCLDNLD